MGPTIQPPDNTFKLNHGSCQTYQTWSIFFLTHIFKSFPSQMASLSFSLHLLLVGAAATIQAKTTAASPSDLRVDWQRCPALGVSTTPALSWVLPSCDGQSNAMQSSYRIKMYVDAAPRALIYDSGTVAGKSKVIFVCGGDVASGGSVLAVVYTCARARVTGLNVGDVTYRAYTTARCSIALVCVLALLLTNDCNSVWHGCGGSTLCVGNASVAVKYKGAPLKRGTVYAWTVTTASAGCGSRTSTMATFITECAWDNKATWIGAGNNRSTFNLLRTVVHAPPRSQLSRVVGYVTAQNSWAGMLMNYKLWINGKLASVGPGQWSYEYSLPRLHIIPANSRGP